MAKRKIRRVDPAALADTAPANQGSGSDRYDSGDQWYISQTYMPFPFLGNETVNALLVSIRSIAGVIFDNIPPSLPWGLPTG